MSEEATSRREKTEAAAQKAIDQHQKPLKVISDEEASKPHVGSQLAWKVRKGDNLSTIAEALFGTQSKDLVAKMAEMNPDKADVLEVDSLVLIPPGIDTSVNPSTGMLNEHYKPEWRDYPLESVVTTRPSLDDAPVGSPEGDARDRSAAEETSTELPSNLREPLVHLLRDPEADPVRARAAKEVLLTLHGMDSDWFSRDENWERVKGSVQMVVEGDADKGLDLIHELWKHATAREVE